MLDTAIPALTQGTGPTQDTESTQDMEIQDTETLAIIRDQTLGMNPIPDSDPIADTAPTRGTETPDMDTLIRAATTRDSTETTNKELLDTEAPDTTVFPSV